MGRQATGVGDGDRVAVRVVAIAGAVGLAAVRRVADLVGKPVGKVGDGLRVAQRIRDLYRSAIGVVQVGHGDHLRAVRAGIRRIHAQQQPVVGVVVGDEAIAVGRMEDGENLAGAALLTQRPGRTLAAGVRAEVVGDLDRNVVGGGPCVDPLGPSTRD